MVDVLAEPSLPPPGCAMPPPTALDRLARSPALRKPPCLAEIFLQNHLLCLTLSPTLAPCAAASPKTTSQGFTGPQGGAATSGSAEAGGSTDADTGSGSAAAGRGPGSAAAGAGRAGTAAGGRSGSAPGGGGTQAGTSAGGPGDSPTGSEAADRAGAGDVRSDSADEAALPPTAESRAGDIEGTDSVLSVIQANPDLSSLYDAIEFCGLAATLEDPALVATVFAPTNQAFQDLVTALGPDADAVFTNRDLVKTVVLYHVHPQEALAAADLTDGQTLSTLNGAEVITVAVADAAVKLDPSGAASNPTIAVPAAVVSADIPAAKSIIHIIDKVLVPANALPPSSPPTSASASAAAIGTAG
uniref:FAS1 domain-containing protein n=1 Tax=Auxenochlorella protothecoides TaxID=3075 RepID=A0A1D1ZN66_AUXPR